MISMPAPDSMEYTARIPQEPLDWTLVPMGMHSSKWIAVDGEFGYEVYQESIQNSRKGLPRRFVLNIVFVEDGDLKTETFYFGFPDIAKRVAEEFHQRNAPQPLLPAVI